MNIPLAVVMPVYNEAASIAPAVEEWLPELAAIPGSVLVVVNDGSTDATAGILREMAAAHACLLVIQQQNQGHGAAVLRGYREALSLGAEWIFQTDSDRQISAHHFAGFWRRRDAAGFLQGVRQNRDDPPARLRLSRAHRRLLATLFGHSPRDPNIPFRLMRASVLALLLERLPDAPFAPNVLLSLLAQRGGSFEDAEPVPHRPREHGVASIRGWKTLRIAVRCLRELIEFRFDGYRRQEDRPR